MFNLKKRLQQATLGILVFMMLISVPASARQVKADAPQTYTVKKGDTLWDIASVFLDEPWVWPELWRTNTQIQNPHLIYPGDVINLAFFNGQPVMSLKREKPVIVLSPASRKSVKAVPIDILPASAMQPYIHQHHVVDEDTYQTLPYVLGNHHGNVRFVDDNLILSSLTNGTEDQLQVVRKQSTIYAPDGEVLGVQLTHIANTTRFSSAQDGVDVLRMTQSFQEAKRGDKLIPYMPDRMPDLHLQAAKQQQGVIVGDLHDHNLLGKYDVVIVNLGNADVAPGMVMGVYTAGPDIIDGKRPQYIDEPGGADGLNLFSKKLAQPALKVGEIIIFKTFNKASYGLISRASEGITKGFIVAKP